MPPSIPMPICLTREPDMPSPRAKKVEKESPDAEVVGLYDPKRSDD